MDKEIIIEAMKQFQRKCGCIREISRLTTQIGESASRDDRVSIQMLINIRQEEMEKAEQCDQNLYDLERRLPFTERLAFEQLLKGKYSEEEPESFEVRKIKELSNEIQTLLKRTIEIDRTINKRISGDKSFYKT